jgi:hypothetical protein
MNSCFLSGCAIIMVALCACGVSFAQGEHGEGGGVCDLCVCASDATCTADGACASQTGCSETTFTPACTGTYTFVVKLRCQSNADCEFCLACAYIYTGGVWYAGQQAGCVVNQCSAVTTVGLTGGVTYKLYACLRACAGTPCTECSECTAFASVYQTSDDCAAPCN